MVNSIIFSVEHGPGAKQRQLTSLTIITLLQSLGVEEIKGYFTNSTLYHDYLICIILSNRVMLLSYFKNLHNYRQKRHSDGASLESREESSQPLSHLRFLYITPVTSTNPLPISPLSWLTIAAIFSSVQFRSVQFSGFRFI